MRVLALNPGSSSLRFRVLEGDGRSEACVARGSVASLGPEPRASAGLGAHAEEVAGIRARDHAEALAWVVDWIGARIAAGALDPIEALGVRVVLGDPHGRAGALVDPPLERELERLCDLAPLHGRASLDVLRAARAWGGGALPVVAVYDSAFHADLPEVARTYALPEGWAERHGVRRFGYHGLAIASALEEHARRTGAHGERRRVVLHLGSGASATAVRGERSVDTSMGFSPLEGLVMATRSGDLDPSLVAWLARAEGLSADEVVRALNERAGLAGVSGTSGDMREILRRRAAGDARCALAFEVFAARARQHLAARIASLGGLDELLFSGGIGEHAPVVREAVCAPMGWCGIELDPALNLRPAAADGRISRAGSPAAVHVVAVDEERLIARTTRELLTGVPRRGPGGD